MIHQEDPRQRFTNTRKPNCRNVTKSSSTTLQQFFVLKSMLIAGIEVQQEIRPKRGSFNIQSVETSRIRLKERKNKKYALFAAAFHIARPLHTVGASNRQTLLPFFILRLVGNIACDIFPLLRVQLSSFRPKEHEILVPLTVRHKR